MSGGLLVDAGGLLVDVQWMSSGLAVDCWWILNYGGLLMDCWWIAGGLAVDCWWMSSGLAVDFWWIHNYGGLLGDCWWTAGRLLVYYGGEYLDNFITIQWLDNLNHLFDYRIESKIRLINSNSA